MTIETLGVKITRRNLLRRLHSHIGGQRHQSPVQPGCLNRHCGQKVLPGASSLIRHLHVVQPIWSPDFGPPKVEGGLEFEVTAVTAEMGQCAVFDWRSLSEYAESGCRRQVLVGKDRGRRGAEDRVEGH
jgi:hypothetical protein